jgi:uncharacterized membrane protein
VDRRGVGHPTVAGDSATAPDPTVHAVGTLLGAGTLVVVGLVLVGTLLALAAGRRPLTDHGPALDPSAILRDLVALRPEGFLWLGIVVGVALPAARVALAIVGFAREGDRRATAVAVAVLAVLGLSVVIALVSRGTA